MYIYVFLRIYTHIYRNPHSDLGIETNTNAKTNININIDVYPQAQTNSTEPRRTQDTLLLSFSNTVPLSISLALAHFISVSTPRSVRSLTAFVSISPMFFETFFLCLVLLSRLCPFQISHSLTHTPYMYIGV